jgi:hypothetical protein
MSIFSRLFGDAKSEALSLGLRVEEVMHELPCFTQPGNRFDRLERRDCLKYSVQRSSSSRPTSWSMLQRDKKNGAQFDNGWTFVSYDPDCPQPDDALRSTLSRMAGESDDGVLEFQATSQEVSIYSQTGGGRRWARHLHRYLKELSNL